jgi:hypothetical protein
MEEARFLLPTQISLDQPPGLTPYFLYLNVPSKCVNRGEYESATFSLEAGVYMERAKKMFLAFCRCAPWNSQYIS